MTKYIVIERPADSPVTSAVGSVEEAVCDIASSLMDYPGPTDNLMAVAETSAISTLNTLKNRALCSLEISPQSFNTWCKDVSNIYDAMGELQKAKDKSESLLEEALEELDDAFRSSQAFSGYTPSDHINVYGALYQLGTSELERVFERALIDMYKLKSFQPEEF
ncbi:MAG: hypothetical protein KGP13_13595 [Burkholderiales bacterium]|nr:hypothetical protein [Burkholderiales bacterium]